MFVCSHMGVQLAALLLISNTEGVALKRKKKRKDCIRLSSTRSASHLSKTKCCIMREIIWSTRWIKDCPCFFHVGTWSKHIKLKKLRTLTYGFVCCCLFSNYECDTIGLLTIEATKEDLVGIGCVAETRSGNSQAGPSHQSSEQRGDAVDLQNIFYGGVHTVAVKVQNYVW